MELYCLLCLLQCLLEQWPPPAPLLLLLLVVVVQQRWVLQPHCLASCWQRGEQQ
jgi:hypothetical protein